MHSLTHSHFFFMPLITFSLSHKAHIQQLQNSHSLLTVLLIKKKKKKNNNKNLSLCLVTVYDNWSFKFHHGGLSSRWSLIRVVFIRVVHHQCGPQSVWSLIRVVSSEWSVNVIPHQSGLLMLSLIRVVCYQGGFHQSGLLSVWSLIRVVCYQCGLSTV